MGETVHGSAVLAGAHGLLIRGPSGSGKSMLAAALLRAGARLIADDRVFLSACHGRIIASGPASLSGKLELRGRGIVPAARENSAVIRLVVDLMDPADIERMPAQGEFTTEVLGIATPRQPAPARSDAAIVLVEAALRALAPQGQGLRPNQLWG